VPVFVDTNVLLYARDASEPDKQPRAREWLDLLWSERAGRVSLQVLTEYYQAVTRKLRPGLDRETARADVRDLSAWRPVRVDEMVMEDAWRLEDRYGLSIWDALVVASARAAGCRHLLTEDLQHGQDLDGLVVVNPFRVPPGTLG
jgi:predicted nucleic acid-binding protein